MPEKKSVVSRRKLALAGAQKKLRHGGSIDTFAKDVNKAHGTSVPKDLQRMPKRKPLLRPNQTVVTTIGKARVSPVQPSRPAFIKHEITISQVTTKGKAKSATRKRAAGGTSTDRLKANSPSTERRSTPRPFQQKRSGVMGATDKAVAQSNRRAQTSARSRTNLKASDATSRSSLGSTATDRLRSRVSGSNPKVTSVNPTVGEGRSTRSMAGARQILRPAHTPVRSVISQAQVGTAVKDIKIPKSTTPGKVTTPAQQGTGPRPVGPSRGADSAARRGSGKRGMGVINKGGGGGLGPFAQLDPSKR